MCFLKFYYLIIFGWVWTSSTCQLLAPVPDPQPSDNKTSSSIPAWCRYSARNVWLLWTRSGFWPHFQNRALFTSQWHEPTLASGVYGGAGLWRFWHAQVRSSTPALSKERRKRARTWTSNSIVPPLFWPILPPAALCCPLWCGVTDPELEGDPREDLLRCFSCSGAVTEPTQCFWKLPAVQKERDGWGGERTAGFLTAWLMS